MKRSKPISTRSAPNNQRPKRRRSTITVQTYKNHAFYPRVVRAVTAILADGKVVAPVDVIVRMGLLDLKRVEDWRRGRVPYLERMINCGLGRLSKLLRILRFHAHDLKLQPSWTAYMRWGKGPKLRLRFTKSGDQNLEEAYATHFVPAGQGAVPPAESEARKTS